MPPYHIVPVVDVKRICRVSQYRGRADKSETIARSQNCDIALTVDSARGSEADLKLPERLKP
jgi:acetolactate synthase regulatory subunit